MANKDLIIVRHGIYSKRGENPKLTSPGRQQIQRLGEFIVERDKGYFHIATSPLVRAVESAEILREILRGDSGLEIWDELNCEYENLFQGQAERITERVMDNTSPEKLVLVGHYALRDFARYYSSQSKIRDLKTGHAIEVTSEHGNPSPLSYIP